MLSFDPPLLNSSSRWASTREELEALYNCPFTGAVTTRTSLLHGFEHEDSIHQHCFFEASSMAPAPDAVDAAQDGAVSSLNTLGYSPVPLAEYIEMMHGIETEALSRGRRRKPIIYSVAGSIDEVAQCQRLLLHAAEGLPPRPRYMELNLSCPNIPHKPPPAYSQSELSAYLSALAQRSSPGLVLGIKTPPYTFQAQFDALVAALLSAAAPPAPCPVSFITATNTLGSCLALRPASAEPALASQSGEGIGGLAGAALHPLALGNVRTLRRMLDAEPGLRGIEIIGVGGVADAAGWRRMRAVGAAAVGVGTALGHEGVGVFEKILGAVRSDGQDRFL